MVGILYTIKKNPSPKIPGLVSGSMI